VISIFANEPVIELSLITSFLKSEYEAVNGLELKLATFPFESVNGIFTIAWLSSITSMILGENVVFSSTEIVIISSSISISQLPLVSSNK